MKRIVLVILAIVLILGLLSVVLSIVGVATKDWISVSGNTDELRVKFGQLTDPAGLFIRSLAAALPGVPLAAIVGIVNQTLVQVERQLSANLQPTTYSLFDKKVSNTAAEKVAEFELPQGLIIAGLAYLFIGTVSAAIMMIFSWGKIVFFRVISVGFLVLGSVLILLGYLFFTRIIVEDFGYDLGIKAQLGASFILVVLSSVIGFITAVLVGSTMVLHRHHSGSIVRTQSISRADQLALDDAAPVVVTTQTIKTTKVQSNNEYF